MLRFIEAIGAPLGAALGDKGYRASRLHLQVWKWITVGAAALAVAANWFRWDIPHVGAALLISWAATLLCRLALAEQDAATAKAEIDELIRRIPK